MSAWRDLLPVQDLDSTLDQLTHRFESLPERAARDAIDGELAALRRSVDEVETQKRALTKEQTRLEDEIALLEDKVRHEEEALYKSGADIKTAQALQDEIGSLRRRIGRIEDDELEIMEQIEPLDARLSALAAEKAALDERATAATAALAEAEAAVDRERQSVQAERAAAAAPVAPDALAEYEKVRGQLGGVAVAELTGGVCGACHLKLSAVEIDRIKHLPPDEPVRCEECGRFLVR